MNWLTDEATSSLAHYLGKYLRLNLFFQLVARTQQQHFVFIWDSVARDRIRGSHRFSQPPPLDFYSRLLHFLASRLPGQQTLRGVSGEDAIRQSLKWLLLRYTVQTICNLNPPSTHQCWTEAPSHLSMILIEPFIIRRHRFISKYIVMCWSRFDFVATWCGCLRYVSHCHPRRRLLFSSSKGIIEVSLYSCCVENTSVSAFSFKNQDWVKVYWRISIIWYCRKNGARYRPPIVGGRRVVYACNEY